MRKNLVFMLIIFLISGCASSPKQNQPLRDASIHCLQTSAPGDVVIGNNVVSIDLSQTSQGYVTARYLGNQAQVKLRIFTPDSEDPYTYNLHPKEEVFPLTGGNGTYRIEIYEHLSDTKYAIVFSDHFEVQLENDYLPFLYPSQYVNFNPSCPAIKKAQELAMGCHNDLEVVSQIYHFIIDYISYDNEKAASIQEGTIKGYLPNVDAIYQIKKGICFDYAALIATMLRTQSIPTKMEIGYALNKKDPAKSVYHAWISVYIKDIGWLDDLIQFDGVHWQMMDPTFASHSKSKETRRYISDASNYVTKYCY